MSEHGSWKAPTGTKAHERSAALPASTTPAPPQPLISPTGSVPLDALAHIVNRAAEPWQGLPDQTPVQQVATVVNGVLGILNMDVVVDAFNLGVGTVMSAIPFPELPAATLTALHIGSLHTHTHPPSLVPPAPPVPLPSIGPVTLGGCVSVLIGGLPAARAGDLGVSLTCGTLAPPFEIATGSSSVFIGGSRAARMGDFTKHCGAALPSEFSAIGTGFAAAVGILNAAAAPDPLAIAMAAAQTAADAAKAALAALMGSDPGVPPCNGMVMLGNPTVMIGGFPIPPIENFARAFCQKLLKPLANALHGLIKAKLPPGRAANFFHELVCHTTGHPVDVASGRMLTSAVDLELPGPIALKFKRQYATSWSDRDSVLGWGWSHSYDEAVWLEPDEETGGTKTVYRAEDGREIEFDTSNTGPRPAWLQLNEYWDPFNRLTLRVMGKAHYEIERVDGLTREFRVPVDRRRVSGTASLLPGAPLPGGRRDLAKLTLIRDRALNRITFNYDSAGNLDTIIDSGGREIRLESDRAGRLSRILVPHPMTSGFVEQVRYVYSAAGDLVEVYDALGKPFRMEYEGHLLIRETNRNGLSFYFKYEGGGPEAKCVKTWGDGDIYTRALTYDVVNHRTIVEDSYGHKTTYQMNGDNAVIAVTDALGGTTKYAFDSAYQKISETDAVGGETKWEYDARGNCTRLTMPDGAEVVLEYNVRNQPVVAIDPNKGRWQWGYDGRGLLVVRVDALDRRVRFVWQADPNAAIAEDPADRRTDGPAPPKRLVAVHDPADHRTTLTYDLAGNIIALRGPDGATSQWKYDNLGHALVAIDPRGNRQLRDYDALGRITKLREADGNVREMIRDAEGNVLAARDRQHDVRFAYQGMGRMRSRSEAGTTVEFEYDREERLIGIKNEHGNVFRFELGPTGLIAGESGFDGVTKKYERDVKGRVTKIDRPDRRFTTYAYDAMGRITEVKHNDGTGAAYAYREDGVLIQAKNDAALVTFERDPLGRVVKEIVGDDWVESTYDALGLRVGLRSSRGLDQAIERNDVGDVMGIRASTKRQRAQGDDVGTRTGDDAWSARFQRDSVGLELERTLPGGVNARWERDALGRPKSHSIWSGDLSKAAWHYTWGVDDRLTQVVDLLKGPTQYQHDGLGNLALAAHFDGRVDLRMPDAIGNLFRTRERADRKYGPAGQLLEAQHSDGRIVRYEYDPEGNLVRKVETPPGTVAGEHDRVWTYEWKGVGTLAKVVRPDGDAVEFTYDALGRRLSKTYRGRVTRWVWDGKVPLHEWVEGPAHALPASDAEAKDARPLDELAARRRREEFAARPAQGPPPDTAGTPAAPITWLFEPGTFVPLAKLVGGVRQSIITDHQGTPLAMYDDAGAEVWAASVDAYGNFRDVTGDIDACPFRWPGQYADVETGLYYNRFRYYDPEGGGFIRPDPIGVLGGFNLYRYPFDPTTWADPLGLSGSCFTERQQKMLDEDTGYNISPEQWFHDYPAIGRYGSFITDQQGLNEASGRLLSPGRYTVGEESGPNQVTPATVSKMERDLGLEPGSLQNGFRVTKVDGINDKSPRSPLSGNSFFCGPGKGLPGGAPEMVIDSIPTR